jgi:choline dehydrogenase-like flavoprotein
MWTARLIAFAECLSRYDNFVTLDPEVKDAWGIPALKVHMTWSDNELRLWQDAQEQGAEMLQAAGASNVRHEGEPSVPGFGIHEMGTARMGDDPKSSVLNRWSRTHDVENIYCTDGAAFVSIGCQNPTLTMMALTARACEQIVERGKRGELG